LLLISTPENIQVVKLRRMTLVGHVIYMEENRYAYTVLVEKTVGKRHFVRP
jgi:hypothetical protein